MAFKITPKSSIGHTEESQSANHQQRVLDLASTDMGAPEAAQN
jgi:hypothetical protein